MERCPWEQIFAERFLLRGPPSKALQFLVAKEPGDIILKGQPSLQREKFRGRGPPEGSEFTQNFVAHFMEPTHL